MSRSNEPLWWGPFSAGMMVGALFLPAFIVLTGFILPFFRWDDAEAVRHLVIHPLTRILLFVVIALTFFHAAHKFRFVLVDLGLKGAKTAVAVLCYGSAIAGSVVAGVLALNLV